MMQESVIWCIIKRMNSDRNIMAVHMRRKVISKTSGNANTTIRRRGQCDLSDRAKDGVKDLEDSVRALLGRVSKNSDIYRVIGKYKKAYYGN